MAGLAAHPQLLLLICGAVVAGVVQGISGFAFAMISMSIWAWGLDPQKATILAVFGGLCGQILTAILVRRRWVAADLLPFIAGGLIGVPIGTWLLPQISASTFKLILGLLLIFGCPLMLLGRRDTVLRKPGKAGDGLAGMAGGIIGGISGMTGIAPAIWTAWRGHDKDSQRALVQSFNLVTLAAAMGAFLFQGMVSRAMLPDLGIVAIALVIPAFIGARIYSKLSEAAFRRVILVLLTLSGVALVSSVVGG